MKDKLSNIMLNIVAFLKQTWIIILAILIVVVAGVSSVEIIKEEVLKIDPDVEYVESGYLYFSCEALDTLNPILSQSEDIYHLSKLIYNSLFDYDENLNMVPELVESYTVDTTGGKVSITLRDDVTWHDGTSLTAGDVQFTINAIKAAGSKSLYYESASKIIYINVKDSLNLDIYFRNAYNASLDDLTFPILPSSQYSSAAALASASDNFKPVGTGQYQYQSYDYLKQLKLKPYKEYFGPVAKKKIKVMILPERSLSSNMLEIDQVTCYVDTSSERKSTVIDKNLTMYDMISNEVEFLLFNQKKSYTGQKEIRQAIAYAIDEQNILENGYMNDGVLTDTIYFPNFLGVADEGSYYNYDFDEAEQKLKNQGYEDKDGDGFLEDEKGEELQLSIIVNKNNGTRLAAARLIRKDLERAGFRAELSELSWKDYQAAITAGDYDLALVGYSVEARYDLRELFNGKNLWKYTNNSLLTKANQLEQLHTAEEYTTLYGELKTELLDELPYYSLCYKKIGLVGVEGFTAEKTPMFNDYYKNCETWSWTYAVDKTEEESSEETEDKDGE